MIERLEHWVAEQGQRRPDATAVVLGDERHTYGRLEALSNQLSRCLLELGCERGDRVCLLSPKSPSAIAAIIGIYKAGAIYVPLDPASPAPRLAKIIDSCEPRWLLAAGPVTGLIDDLAGDGGGRSSLRVGWLGLDHPQTGRVRMTFSARDLEGYPPGPVGTPGGRSDPAHILYTSGSTGQPKGVMITHDNVLQFIQWAVRYFDMRPGDRNSCHPPLHFDLSMLDIFGTFASGGELHLVPPDINVLPNKLAEFVRTSALVQWFSVPSVLNYMAKFDVVRFDDFPALRRLLWCGEVFPTPALIYWMQRLPHVQFTNLYGPTETTIASSYYTLPACPQAETVQVPIGRACEGEELFVLDDRLQPVRSGDVGELCIGGAGVSPGYWRDPDRTRAAFLSPPGAADPEARMYRTGDLARVGDDGLVYFLGRTDSQIKHRGYRIELGEIETALHAMGSLREVAVVGVTASGFEGTSICCAYVPAAGRSLSPTMLRQHLSRRLPPYMLPARWMALRELPKNANGKIDRRRLTEMFQLEEAVGSR